MSNYKWILFKRGELTYTMLADEDLHILPTVFEVKNVNMLLEDELAMNGVKCDIQRDLDGGFYYDLSPSEIKTVEITAPLYNEDGERISDSHTETTADPAQYGWTIETYNKCFKKVAEVQTARFKEVFKQNSLDGGRTGLVHVTKYVSLRKENFPEEYIPTGYIEITDKFDFTDREARTVLFMRKINANKKGVTITVPENYRGLVIGKAGENIKRIAREINASYIDVKIPKKM